MPVKQQLKPAISGHVALSLSSTVSPASFFLATYHATSDDFPPGPGLALAMQRAMHQGLLSDQLLLLHTSLSDAASMKGSNAPKRLDSCSSLQKLTAISLDSGEGS